MLSDDMIDGFLSGGFLPGTGLITLTDVASNTADVMARWESPEPDILSLLGPTKANTGERIYFIWKAQDGYVRPRPLWYIYDDADATTWRIDKVEDDIQRRSVVCTCTRKPT